MKQKLWGVVLVGFLVSFAALASSFFSNEPTPKQMYRDVNSQPEVQPVSNASTLNSAASQTNAEQSQQPTAAAVIPANPTVALSSSQVNAVRINQLDSRAKEFASTLSQLDQRVANLSQEVAQLEKSNANKVDDGVGGLSSEWQALKDGFSQVNETLYLSIGGGSVLLLGLGFLAGRSRRESKQQAPVAIVGAMQPDANSDPQDDLETKAEYDFMGTDEAIPAMLDLARSYLAMDNNAEAKVVLEKVVMRGDQAQKEEAEFLIKQITDNEK